MSVLRILLSLAAVQGGLFSSFSPYLVSGSSLGVSRRSNEHNPCTTGQYLQDTAVRCISQAGEDGIIERDGLMERASSVEQRVKKIIAEQLGVKEDEIFDSASFVDDLGADDLDTVELFMALEEEFDMEIPDEEAEKITTVQAAIDYIDSHSI